jgi:hypothetical protein
VSLYAITTEMQAILEAIDQAAGNPEAEAALTDHLASIAEGFDAKADAYGQLIRVCEARAGARREEAERMVALAASDEATADRLRTALLKAMQVTGRLKVETPHFRFAVRNNGGKIPLLVTDEAAIPVAYRVPKVTEVLDKEAIRADLEAGKAVPGAALGQRGVRLELK